MLAGMLHLSHLWVPSIFHLPLGLVGCCLRSNQDGWFVGGWCVFAWFVKATWQCVPCFDFLHCKSVVTGFVLSGLLPKPALCIHVLTKNKHVFTHTHTHTHTHTLMHMYVLTHTHTHKHTYIYIYTYAHAHQPHLSFQTMHALTLVNMCSQWCTHMLEHARTHTLTHTYILCNMTNTHSLLAAEKMGVCLYWVVCLPVVCSAWGWSYLLPVLSVSVNSPSPVGHTSPHHLSSPLHYTLGFLSTVLSWALATV